MSLSNYRPQLLLMPMLLSAVFLPVVVAFSEEQIRTWTSYEDTVLQAAFVSADDTTVTLDRRDGSKQVTIDQSRLIFEDQSYIAGAKIMHDASSRTDAWPARTSPSSKEVTRIDAKRFRSEHFEFLCELETSEEFVAEAVGYFEGTLAAVRALPIELRAQPPESWERFVTTFAATETLGKMLQGMPRVHPAESLMAAYFAEHRQIVVSHDVIDGRSREGLMTLKLKEDYGVLVHEIMHQVIDGSLEILPFWLSDGLAEYLALIPQSGGGFRFSEAEAGLRKVLETRYSADVQEIIHPADLLAPPEKFKWPNDLDAHRSALLVVYYLLVLEDKQPVTGDNGLAKSVRALRAVDDRAWALVDEYNKAVKANQPALAAYRKAVEQFKGQAEAYNKRIDAATSGSPALIEGGEPGGRVVVGGGAPLAPPVPPKAPVLPDILNHRRDKPLNVAAMGIQFVSEAILRGRSPERFATDLKAAYQEIGIPVTIRASASQRAPVKEGR